MGKVLKVFAGSVLTIWGLSAVLCFSLYLVAVGFMVAVTIATSDPAELLAPESLLVLIGLGLAAALSGVPAIIARAAGFETGFPPEPPFLAICAVWAAMPLLAALCLRASQKHH